MAAEGAAAVPVARAEPTADTALISAAPVAGATDVGLAVGRADMDLPDATTLSAEPTGVVVAMTTDWAVLDALGAVEK